MLRRIVTTLARFGLILSIILWITSYFLYIGWAPGGYVYTLRKAAVGVRPKAGFERYDWRVYARPGLNAAWTPECRTTGGLRIIIPFWIPCGVCGLTWFCARDLTRRKRRQLGLCLDCGYPREGLTEPRCPECGCAFDRARDTDLVGS